MTERKKTSTEDLASFLIQIRGSQVSVEDWNLFVNHCINQPNESKILIKEAYDLV